MSLAYFGFSYMSTALGHMSAFFFGVICHNVIASEHVSLRVGLADWKRICGFGLLMLTIGAVGGISVRITELLI